MSTLNPNQILEPPRTRRQETINSATEKLKDGFCIKSRLSPAEVGFIFESWPDAATIRVESAGLHGGRHYSIHDLIGHSVNGMVYVVTEYERFASFMSLLLERDFLKKNPKPDSRIRASFTSFMHENKLHWSKCCGANTLLQNKVIREKIRALSSKTGKTSTELISDLLDSALINS
jgi:hypothetical protein